MAIIEYERIPLYHRLEKIVLDEAVLLARERYEDHLDTALGVMFTKFKIIGDVSAANACHELISRIREMQGLEEE